MPKLIFTSRYLQSAPPAQLENYVRYIGTREGVEKIDKSKRLLPATENQKRFIHQLIRDIPAAKDMLEYTDFLLRPTVGNASEFISCALDQNLETITERENYVDYIANRPRVERVGEHGLFTDAGRPVVLSQVQKEVVEHKGAVWTHVISLRREDAARLGYDQAEQWMALLRSKRAMLSKHMKIDSANLRWYAAFHNESHHPHVHLLVYSVKDNDGYLTEKSIEAMRSELAHDIFRQDFAQIYQEQNQARAELKRGAADTMQEMMDTLRDGTLVNPKIEQMMLQLSERLQNISGKKVYGYLKRDVKNLIDQIVDELEKDSRVSALYREWGKWQDEIHLTYRKEAPPLPPLSRQKQFKSIKNMVISEALKLGGHHFTFADETEADVGREYGASGESEVNERADFLEGEHFFYAAWNTAYKEARKYFYGDFLTRQDLQKAFQLLLAEAESGNALAMYDLGRMCADGLGCEADLKASQEWYKKALGALEASEQAAKKRERPYLQYRIGKMYAAGIGTEQDDGKALEWLSDAAEAGHKYAQYSLAGLYYQGRGTKQDYTKALELYQLSARQRNPYADYELAKMYQSGIGTEKENAKAEKHFCAAFEGFLKMEEQSHEDKLQYRLGQMFHTGTGTTRDDSAAENYWRKAARLGNQNAQYALGKLLLENRAGDIRQAVAWIEKSARAGNAAAQYTLGRIYCDGEYVPRDLKRARKWFGRSADQNNEQALYQMGKLYLSEEFQEKDAGKAAEYLTAAAKMGNQYAQYTLGKLYLQGEEVPQDKEKAILFLQMSVAQGNPYAEFLLEHMDDVQNPSTFLAATRLLRGLEKLFREDYRNAEGSGIYHIDRKRRRKLSEKKQAQGHRRDDQETVQQFH
ncbi:MAG: relaxase MobL [Lachnospiraceae bacterium]|nr:relaxase MobL [Lachnospiraceae bacterium]